MAVREFAQQGSGHPPTGGADATDADLAGHLVTHRDDVILDGL